MLLVSLLLQIANESNYPTPVTESVLFTAVDVS